MLCRLPVPRRDLVPNRACIHRYIQGSLLYCFVLLQSDGLGDSSGWGQ